MYHTVSQTATCRAVELSINMHSRCRICWTRGLTNEREFVIHVRALNSGVGNSTAVVNIHTIYHTAMGVFGRKVGSVRTVVPQRALLFVQLI